MSTETQENYSTAYFDWIEKAISEDYIKYYDFAKFINKEEISNGSYGKISRANWNDSDTVMVLKSSYDSDIKKIVNEIKMQPCWSDDSNERPTLQQVVDSLRAIISEDYDTFQSIIHTKNKIKSQSDMHSNSASFIMYSNNSELFLSKLIQEINLESIVNERHSHILHQAEKLFLKIFDVEDSIDILIDKLIVLLIKTHDEGNDFNETKHFINQCIFLSNQNSNNIFEWLKENQVESKHVYLLGFFYFNNINFEKNNNKAFKLFLSASTNNYSIAQVYLAKSSGKNVNEVQSIFKLYENGQIIDDIDEVNYWYHKAANNNNKEALYKLGEFYEIGKGVDKNLVRAAEVHEVNLNELSSQGMNNYHLTMKRSKKVE
ncbi:20094_t:CDS:2 [Funneliformis geosporum]|uniref:20094_t:CDS:1 n=1 Tax=Funneliformis geosporum TaxID=1117311 RepID=A0A9W4SQ01_9GLOM|nr:20094_t:CDS:2 [Funneliformis geosporum]